MEEGPIDVIKTKLNFDAAAKKADIALQYVKVTLILVLLLSVVVYIAYTAIHKLGLIDDDAEQTLYNQMKSRILVISVTCFLTLFFLIVIPQILKRGVQDSDYNRNMKNRMNAASNAPKLIVNGVDVNQFANSTLGIANGLNYFAKAF